MHPQGVLLCMYPAGAENDDKLVGERGEILQGRQVRIYLQVMRLLNVEAACFIKCTCVWTTASPGFAQRLCLVNL